MAKHTLVLHYCGGAAARISHSVFSELGDISNALPELREHYIDTRDYNLDTPIRGDLFRITSADNSKIERVGSGNERRGSIRDITLGVQKYLDEKKYLKPITGEFHVVVSSMSGGKHFARVTQVA